MVEHKLKAYMSRREPEILEGRILNKYEYIHVLCERMQRIVRKWEHGSVIYDDEEQQDYVGGIYDIVYQ